MSETTILKFTNSFSKKIKIIIEPWCHEYSINYGSTLEIIDNGKCDEAIEINYLGEDIVVHGLTHKMEIFYNGKTAIPFE